MCVECVREKKPDGYCESEQSRGRHREYAEESEENKGSTPTGKEVECDVPDTSSQNCGKSRKRMLATRLGKEGAHAVQICRERCDLSRGCVAKAWEVERGILL
jgi:hypothetical protein